LIQNIVRWRSDQLDGAVGARCLGTPGQTKVSGDLQRETTHEICCLAAELPQAIPGQFQRKIQQQYYPIPSLGFASVLHQSTEES
jgi:hypothetical protein